MDLTPILQASISSDAQERTNALQILENTSASNFPFFMDALASYVANSANPDTARKTAGIYFKNLITKRSREYDKSITTKWYSIAEDLRSQIKQSLIFAMSNEQTLTNSVSQCITAIAAIEFVDKTWFDLLDIFSEQINNDKASNIVKIAILDTIGYICQDIKPVYLEPLSRKIFELIVNGISLHSQTEQKDLDSVSRTVYLSAARALRGSIEFAVQEFSNETERNFLMELTVKIANHFDTDIRVVGLQILVNIVVSFYEHMEMYMPVLFNITMDAMKSSTDEIILQGIEFWSSICDQEIELKELEKQSVGDGSDFNRHYSQGALPHIMPIILEKIVETEEDLDADEWCPSKAAAACLVLMSNTVSNAILPIVLPFVIKNIDNEKWEYRNAAIMAFGSILGGPDPTELKNIVIQAMEKLLSRIEDSHSMVRDTVLWTLGRVFEYIPKLTSSQAEVGHIIKALLHGLTMEPQIASTACWSLSTFVTSMHDSSDMDMTSNKLRPSSSVLSLFYEELFASIMRVIERPDSDQHTLRKMAFEALMSLLKHAPNDVEPICLAVMEKLLSILHDLVQMQTNSLASGGDSDSKHSFMVFEMLQLLCSVLQVSALYFSHKRVDLIVQNSVPNLLRALNNSSDDSLSEDILFTLSVFTQTVENRMSTFFDQFYPIIKNGVSFYSRPNLCVACISLIGDAARTIGDVFKPHAQEVLSLFIHVFENSDVNYSIITATFNTLADIAYNLEKEFSIFCEKFYMFAVQVLHLPFIQVDDFDLIDSLNEMRIASIDFLTLTIFTMCIDANNMPLPGLQFLDQVVKQLVFGLVNIASDHNCSYKCVKKALYLLGDLVSIYKTSIESVFEIQSLMLFLNQQKTSENEEITKVAGEVQSKLKSICNIN